MRIPVDLGRCLRHGAKQITSSRLTSCWTVIIFSHFITQVYLHGVTFSENNHARSLTSLCLHAAGESRGLVVTRDHVLQNCDGIPGSGEAICRAISTGCPIGHQPHPDGPQPIPLQDNSTVPSGGGDKIISEGCIRSMQYFHDVFRNAFVEDIATVSFQLWVLAVSVLSAIHNSIPHLAVSAASHSLDTIWAGYRIRNTLDLREKYEQYAVRSACDGVDILEKWWDVRLSRAIPLFVENVLALISVLVTGAALYKHFAGVTFNPVGASPIINRLHKRVMVFSAFLQLSTFFTAMAVGIWIDHVSRGAFQKPLAHATIYQAVFVVVAAAIIPWHLTGCLSIRRELPRVFIAFAVIHVLMLALWPSMFGTSAYVYVFEAWPFFACVCVASFAFITATTVAAIVCRFNFGKGLSDFLAAQAAFARADFALTYDGTSNALAADSHKIPYPEKAYSIESHNKRLPELRYDPNSGGYTRRPIVTSRRGSGLLQRTEGISFLCCIGSRKDRTQRIDQLGEPQFKLPMRPPPQSSLGKRGNPALSILTESTTATQGFVGFNGRRDGGGNAFGRGGIRGLAGTSTVTRFDQRTPLTTYVIPYHWKTKSIGSTSKREFGA